MENTVFTLRTSLILFSAVSLQAVAASASASATIGVRIVKPLSLAIPGTLRLETVQGRSRTASARSSLEGSTVTLPSEIPVRNAEGRTVVLKGIQAETSASGIRLVAPSQMPEGTAQGRYRGTVTVMVAYN